MSDPRNDHGKSLRWHGVVPELKNEVERLQKELAVAKAKISTAKAMLKALDAYWELHPDAPYNDDGDCPVCHQEVSDNYGVQTLNDNGGSDLSAQ